VARAGEPVVVTIGHARRPFACHVCTGTVFSGFRTSLDKIAAVGSRLRFSEFLVNLACADCRYVHSFLPGAVQVWPAADGYPAAP
jgi:hypothetical protein